VTDFIGFETLARAFVAFVGIVTLLSMVTAAILQTFFDLGIRYLLQRALVRQWIARRLELVDTAPAEQRRIVAQAAPRDVYPPPITQIPVWEQAPVSLLAWRSWRRILAQSSVGQAIIGQNPFTRRFSLGPERRRKQLRRQRRLKVVEGQLITLAGAGNAFTLYSLPHQQLCGQIGTALQAELELSFAAKRRLITAFAARASRSDLQLVTEADRKRESKGDPDGANSDAERRVSFHAERGLDQLQLSLSREWEWLNHIIGIGLAAVVLGFVWVWAGPHAGDVIPVLIVIGIAGLMVPTARMGLDRLLGGRR
jgi:hypothetical protein